ncbi:MAG: ParB/RepB/Spo0J family partition protein [Patescibacteria group bacterium]
MANGNGKIATLLLDPFRVKPFEGQPRKRFRGIRQLAESIKMVGQVTPIVVTFSGEKGFDAELVDGERRLQACRSANIQVKAVFEEVASGDDRFALAIAANFCRDSHDSIEVAEAIGRLKGSGRSIEDIGTIFGKSSCWVYQHLSLLDLCPEVQNLLKRAGDEQKQTHKQRRARGRMTLSVALLLIPLEHRDQLRAARHIAKQKLSMAAARNYVRGLGEKRGKQLGRKTSPRAKLMVLWNMSDRYRHEIERYATLPRHALLEVLQLANPREARTLRDQMTQLAGDLKGIAKLLDEVGK